MSSFFTFYGKRERWLIFTWLKIPPFQHNYKIVFFCFFLILVARSGPLLFYDHLRSVFQFHNLLIFDNIVRWRHHMKSMLRIRHPLYISSFLPLLSISSQKINGTQLWKIWFDGNRGQRDLNSRPPGIIQVHNPTGPRCPAELLKLLFRCYLNWIDKWVFSFICWSYSNRVFWRSWVGLAIRPPNFTFI